MINSPLRLVCRPIPISEYWMILSYCFEILLNTNIGGATRKVKHRKEFEWICSGLIFLPYVDVLKELPIGRIEVNLTVGLPVDSPSRHHVRSSNWVHVVNKQSSILSGWIQHSTVDIFQNDLRRPDIRVRRAIGFSFKLDLRIIDQINNKDR